MRPSNLVQVTTPTKKESVAQFLKEHAKEIEAEQSRIFGVYAEKTRLTEKAKKDLEEEIVSLNKKRDSIITEITDLEKLKKRHEDDVVSVKQAHAISQEVLRGLETQVEELKGEKMGIESAISYTNQNKEKTQASLLDLVREHQGKLDEIAESEERLATLASHVNTVADEKSRLVRERASLIEELQALTDKKATLEEAVTLSQEALNDIQAQVKEASTALTTLNSQIDTAQDQLEETRQERMVMIQGFAKKNDELEEIRKGLEDEKINFSKFRDALDDKYKKLGIFKSEALEILAIVSAKYSDPEIGGIMTKFRKL